ncbi:MAG: phospholipase D-like domain-containing protein, partial [Nostoc sp.]
MPRIFDNINLQLLTILRETLKVSYRADFCVGYFNLRGWRKIDDLIEQYVGSEKACCRLLIGMQSLPSDEVHAAFTLSSGDRGIDNSAIVRLKKRMAAEFRQKLTIGAPTNQDEAGLRRLSHQLKSQKLIIKLFLRHALHAKLYLVHRNDANTPTVGFLGSSNLTLPGLAKQGELNVKVLIAVLNLLFLLLTKKAKQKNFLLLLCVKMSKNCKGSLKMMVYQLVLTWCESYRLI